MSGRAFLHRATTGISRRVLTRLPPQLRPPVRIQCPNGRVMFTDAGDVRSWRLLQSRGDYNAHTLRAWGALTNLDHWDLVLDVGANYGEMVVGVDFPPTSRVVAVEPNPAVAAHLVRTLHENSLDVEVLTAAISAKSGLAHLDTHAASSGQAQVVQTFDERRPALIVPTVTLDALVDFLMPDRPPRSVLLKVDVEGHENEVLAGASRLIGSDAFVVVLAEVLFTPVEATGLVVAATIAATTVDVIQDAVLTNEPSRVPEIQQVVARVQQE